MVRTKTNLCKAMVLKDTVHKRNLFERGTLAYIRKLALKLVLIFLLYAFSGHNSVTE